MPVPFYEPLSKELGSKLRRVDDIVAELRSIKSPEEIGLMRQAARLNDLGFETMLKVARPGVQGIQRVEIVAEMERVMRREGADHAKFWIASGPAPDWNNLRFEVKPHHRVLEEGDLMAACSPPIRRALIRGIQRVLVSCAACGVVHETRTRAGRSVRQSPRICGR